MHVGGKHEDFAAKIEFSGGIRQRNRYRVGLFTGGAGGAPDADFFVAAFFVLEDFRQYPFFENAKCFGVAKEFGDADQQVLVKGGQFLFVLGQRFEVFADREVVFERNAAGDPATDRGRLVLREINLIAAFQHSNDVVVFVGGKGEALLGGAGLGQRVEGELGDDFVHFDRGQDEVVGAGSDRVAGHAVELGGLRVLYDDQTAGVLDVANAAGAVRAGA